MSASRGIGQRFSLSRWSRRKLQAAAAAPASPPVAGPPAAPPPASPALELPAVESLTFSSDFAAFLRPEVDDRIRRAALKQLFRDPRFNIMDGLDTYIDDYTRADPIAPDVVADLLSRFSAAPEESAAASAGVAATEPTPPAPPSAALPVAPPDAGAPAAEAARTETEPPAGAPDRDPPGDAKR